MRPRWWRRWFAAVDRGWEWLFGIGALVVGLAVLATLPVLQLLSLGYLLEVSGRVARTGELRTAFVGVRKAARFGSVALAVWLLLLVPKLTASLWQDARLIDPASPAASFLGLLTAAICGWIVLHTAAAIWRGGRLRHFLWPRPIRFLRQIVSAEGLSQAWRSLHSYLRSLRLMYYFRLGLKGFLVGIAWLVLPTTLLVAGVKAPLLGMVGAIVLAAVVLLLPFLQARLAASGLLRDGFAAGAVWRDYRRAPLSFALASVATLALAVPLYLLKVELIPREAAWLPSLLFVVSIWPARVLSGFAVARAGRTDRRWWKSAFSGIELLIVLLPLAFLYVLILFLSQYASWYGAWSLYEQHAFLLPVPFLGG